MKIKSKSGAVLGALIAAALVSASAASLGGLTSENLGAESDVVAGCDDDGVDIAYVTDYDEVSQDYEVTGVRLLGLDDACIGQLASVAIDDLRGDGTAGSDGGVGRASSRSATSTLSTVTLDNGLNEDFLIMITAPVNRGGRLQHRRRDRLTSVRPNV